MTVKELMEVLKEVDDPENTYVYGMNDYEEYVPLYKVELNIKPKDLNRPKEAQDKIIGII